MQIVSSAWLPVNVERTNLNEGPDNELTLLASEGDNIINPPAAFVIDGTVISPQLPSITPEEIIPKPVDMQSSSEITQRPYKNENLKHSNPELVNPNQFSSIDRRLETMPQTLSPVQGNEEILTLPKMLRNSNSLRQPFPENDEFESNLTGKFPSPLTKSGPTEIEKLEADRPNEPLKQTELPLILSKRPLMPTIPQPELKRTSESSEYETPKTPVLIPEQYQYSPFPKPSLYFPSNLISGSNLLHQIISNSMNQMRESAFNAHKLMSDVPLDNMDLIHNEQINEGNIRGSNQIYRSPPDSPVQRHVQKSSYMITNGGPLKGSYTQSYMSTSGNGYGSNSLTFSANKNIRDDMDNFFSTFK